MTIAAIAVGDTDARAKMNLVITEANKVPGLEEVHLATINDARERPGDARPFFTEEIDGEASTATAIAIGTIETLADGKVLVIDSAAEPIIVARRENFAVEPGQVYSARWAIRRVQDSSDPLGDTVELGINWLDEDKATLSETIVESLSPSDIDGRLAYSATFSRDEDADETAPAGTRYARPFIRIYGGDARTAVEVVHIWRTAGLPGPKGDTGDVTEAAEAARDAALSARDETLGVAGEISGEIAATALTIEGHGTRLTALEASYGGVSVAAATWTALAALTGTFAGQAAEVAATDTGTHTDPVVGGTVSNAGRFAWSTSPAGWQRIGDSPPAFADTAGSNLFMAGRYPDEAEFLYSSGGGTNVVAATASAELIALGFDTCVARGAAETSIIYGERIPFKMTGDEYYAARVYVQKDSGSANYGVPRLYFYINGGATLLGYVAMTLESTISSTAASYTVNGQATSTYAGADLIAVGTAVSTGTGLGVMGGQFHIATRRIRTIPTTDYPLEGDNNEALLPDTMFLSAGRKMPLYIPNLMKQRFPDDETVMGFLSQRASDNYPFCATGDREMIIDPDLCGATATIDYRPKRRDFNRRRRKTVTLSIAPASGLTGTKNVLLVGDSLTNRALGLIADERVTAAGGTVNWLGTITGQNRSGAVSGELGEGREGKQLSQYTGSVAGMTNVGVGDVATYNGLTNTNKMGYNPFNDGTGFDFGNYVTRFLASATVHQVYFGLGTNDLTDQITDPLATFLADFEANFDIVQTSARAYSGSMKIGWWLPVQPRSKSGDQRWERQWSMIRALTKKVRALSDANTFVVPVWAHLNQEVGWTLDSTPAADTETGIQHAAFDDTTHFGLGALREQVGEVIAAAIKANW